MLLARLAMMNLIELIHCWVRHGFKNHYQLIHLSRMSLLEGFDSLFLAMVVYMGLMVGSYEGVGVQAVSVPFSMPAMNV